MFTWINLYKDLDLKFFKGTQLLLIFIDNNYKIISHGTQMLVYIIFKKLNNLLFDNFNKL